MTMTEPPLHEVLIKGEVSTNASQPLEPGAVVQGTTALPKQNVAKVQAVPDQAKRQTSGLRITDLLQALGAMVGSICLTTLLFTQLAPLGGGIAFVAIAYVLFMAIYALLVAFDESGPVVVDRVVLMAVHSLAITVFVTLIFVVVYTFWEGAEAFFNWQFLFQDMSLAGPLDPLTMGGVAHAIVGTLIQIVIALAITIPLGLITAVFLNEVPGKFSRFVRTIVEAMTALPSIVAGLFIYATFILILGLDKSGFAASLAISVMMLPIMIRASDVVIRLVPGTLKEASIGLGAGQWKTVWHVVLPTSRSGLATAIILATARGIGETSPVLLTSGFTASMNADPFNGPMVSLPLAIFQFVKSPEPSMIARGFGTAFVLMLVVVLLFIIARVLGGNSIDKKEKRIAARQARAKAKIARSNAKRAAQMTVPAQPEPRITRATMYAPTHAPGAATDGSHDEFRREPDPDTKPVYRPERPTVGGAADTDPAGNDTDSDAAAPSGPAAPSNSSTAPSDSTDQPSRPEPEGQ